MNDINPFVQDITANPYDDAPRLVLADWIEDSGDESLQPLGEFIRTQYALEGMHPGNPRRPGLLKLQQALLPDQKKRWAEAVAGLGDARPKFRRGFIEHLDLQLFALVTFNEYPPLGVPLRSLSLFYHPMPRRDRRAKKSVDDSPLRAAELPILEQIEELSLETISVFDEKARAAWMSSPRLRRLQHLTLGRNSAMMEAFLEGKLRHQVRSLTLGANPSGTWFAPLEGRPDWRGAAQLARGRPLKALGTLTFSVALLGDRGFVELLENLEVPALSRVVCQQNPQPEQGDTPLLERLPGTLLARTRQLDLTGASAAVLTRLTDLPHLESLTLNSCRLTGETLAPLHGLPAPLLWSLDLSSNRFGCEGGRAIARLPLLRELRSLRVSYCRIGATGANALCASIPDELATLDLSWNPIGSHGLSHLGGTALEALDLSYCELNDEAALALAEWPSGKLHSLNLASNRLTDRGAGLLFHAPALAKLEALDLSTNSLTDATVEQLLQSPLVRQLRLLLLFGNQITPAAVGRLKKEMRGIVA